MKLQKTLYYSYIVNGMPDGCSYCVRGEKLVLFITGKCNTGCYYCPLSDQKRNKDNVWANEWKTRARQDALEEARLCSAKGAGITGGDPLLRLDRTINYIQMLKQHFGRDFHIHLYATLASVTRLKLERLYNAGLDEIRFHPRLDRKDEWGKILLAKPFSWKFGIEIPAIPTKKKETKELIDFAKAHVHFININELEMSDNNSCQLLKMGFTVKDRLSYGVKGSEELAKSLLKSLEGSKINAHYCTAKLKDAVQMRNRIMRRAANVAKKFDTITEDGTLLRGAVYMKSLMPGPGYRLKLQAAKSALFLKRLYKIKRDMKLEFNLPHDSIEVDRDKLRILASPETVKKLANGIKGQNLVPAIVEEYPTYDALEVEVSFL